MGTEKRTKEWQWFGLGRRRSGGRRIQNPRNNNRQSPERTRGAISNCPPRIYSPQLRINYGPSTRLIGNAESGGN